MKRLHFYLLSTLLLLLLALPSMAQSTSPRLDSLKRVEKQLIQQSNQYVSQQDSIHRVISQCKTDQERLVQHEVLKKIENKMHKNAKHIEKVNKEQEVEQARLDQIEREAQLSKKHQQIQALTSVPLKGQLNGHAWVDMGLPSGTRWATYNVGTSQIHGVGTRIAWGELTTKKTFSPSAYTLNNVDLPCYAGNVKYDLASVKWGTGWYTPTKEQWDELIKYCDWDYVMINGIYGVIFTSKKTYNYIFLPSTGYTDDETYKLKYTTYNLAYWSSTTQRNNGAFSYIANYEQGYLASTNRYIAHCVRAVCDGPGFTSNTTPAQTTTTSNSTQDTQSVESATEQSSSTSELNTSQKQQKKVTAQEVNSAINKTVKTAQKTNRAVNNTVKVVNTLRNIFRR